MELTREQQQFFLDALAKVCSKSLPVELTFTLIPPDEDKEE